MLKCFSGEPEGNKDRARRCELSFPKSKRLVSGRQFKAVLVRNLRFSNGLLTLYMAENNCGHPRLGVSVGKSRGNSVMRNRLKRLLREAFRQNQEQIPAGFDYLLMISHGSAESDKSGSSKNSKKKNFQRMTFEQIRASFLKLVTAAVGKIG